MLSGAYLAAAKRLLLLGIIGIALVAVAAAMPGGW
jgi:hypothetical protein